jgi:hypothetical protein
MPASSTAGGIHWAGRCTALSARTTALMPLGVLAATIARVAPTTATSIIASSAGPMLRTARLRKSSRKGE